MLTGLACVRGNGWELSSSVSLIDGLLNATGVAGTVSSDYIHSSRPIKSIGLSGNFSSGLAISLTGPNGGTLGTAPAGRFASTCAAAPREKRPLAPGLDVMNGDPQQLDLLPEARDLRGP